MIGILESDEFGCATKIALENDLASDDCPETLTNLNSLLLEGKANDVKRLFTSLIKALEEVCGLSQRIYFLYRSLSLLYDI